MLLELGDADVADVRLDQLWLDTLGLDDGAGQLHREGPGLALAADGQDDRRTRLAAHALDRLGAGQAAHRGIVDLDDQVTALEAGTGSRRVFDRSDDPHEAVFHADLDAQSAEFTLRAFAQFLVGFRVEVGRVRVQSRHHAVDGLGNQFLVVDGLDVIRLDPAVYLGEGAQLVQRQGCQGFLVGRGGDRQGEDGTGDGASADEGKFLPAIVHRVESPAGLPCGYGGRLAGSS